MFHCKRCDTLEARIAALLDAGAEERQLFLEAAAADRKAFSEERADWSKERQLLLTRIQAWNPQEDKTPSDVAPSRGTHEAETVDGVHTQEELNALGLVWEAEGEFYYDMRVNPPATYQTVEDCKDVRAFLKSKGLPENAHPAYLNDGGMEDLVESAKKFRKEETKED